FNAIKRNLLHNVALHRTAVQSSESSDLGAAANAVDGNRNARFQSGSCTQTEEESDPWWRVDLGSVNSITAVIITNRNEQENLLNGAEIWIGKSVETNDIKNSPAEGRYVTVLLRGSKKVLTLCEVEVFVANYGNDTRPLPNVALQGEAAQSSTLSFAAASKAIDGRRNSFYSHGSCSHTAVGETNPWWRLDLRQTFVIISIKVTNRGDCCAERLDGAEILVGDSLQNNGNDNPRCATISHIAAGKTSTYQCDGGSMVGRFVNVMIPGKSKTLTLCEVEVYAVPAAAQSTVSSDGLPSHAVSGCSSGVYGNLCCTHTVLQRDPWWRVDLLAVHKVSAVTIFNRVDCCAERLLGAQILIGNSLENNGMKNPRCGAIFSLDNRRTFTFQCNLMEGRYVTVAIPGDNVLTLCEVEVYAFPASMSAMNITSSR
uniref:Si:ch211-215k15.4 n=1 Tax=Stegastes partitus TaxID=144197 RepID=A0A3B4ZQV5_9TELE